MAVRTRILLFLIIALDEWLVYDDDDVITDAAFFFCLGVSRALASLELLRRLWYSMITCGRTCSISGKRRPPPLLAPPLNRKGEPAARATDGRNRVSTSPHVSEAENQVRMERYPKGHLVVLLTLQ